jgi:hypothetical protein
MVEPAIRSAHGVGGPVVIPFCRVFHDLIACHESGTDARRTGMSTRGRTSAEDRPSAVCWSCAPAVPRTGWSARSAWSAWSALVPDRPSAPRANATPIGSAIVRRRIVPCAWRCWPCGGR